MAASKVRVLEDGSVVITEELLKLSSGSFEVSIIQTLTLSHLKIRAVQGFENCESLSQLDLSHNELVTFGAAGSAIHPSASASTSACASQALTSSDILQKSSRESLVSPLSNISLTLTVLDLSFNKLESIVTLAQFKKLEILKLHGNQLENLESDVIAPLQSLPTLKVLTLQLWRYDPSNLENNIINNTEGSTLADEHAHQVIASNPCCLSIPRKDYVKIMGRVFGAKLRCLDGHYFNKELEDPFIRPNAVDDSFAKFQSPPHRSWISEQQIKAGTSVGVSLDPSQVAQAAEKKLNAALEDAKQTVQSALSSFA